MKKRMLGKSVVCFMLVFCMALAFAGPAFAAFDDSKLTWDGKSATLSDIAGKLGYDMVDANGNYKPLYYDSAKELWNKGLLLGADGTFNLDKPLTRTEGVVIILRLLGKEQEAKDAKLTCPFTDVSDWAKYQVAYAAQQGIIRGYSATVFGANDVMTANHYLTLVLRVMGYSDQNGDFTWSSAADKALEINLIGTPCREQYMRSNLFLRDNVAVISYNALFQAKCKNGTMLSASITGQKPEGTVPYATAADKTAAENTDDIFDGTTWGYFVYDTTVTLSFDNGEVILTNRNTVKNITTYTYGTYTVSGGIATFSGDITRYYAYAEMNPTTRLYAYFSTREGHADFIRDRQ